MSPGSCTVQSPYISVALVTQHEVPAGQAPLPTAQVPVQLTPPWQAWVLLKACGQQMLPPVQSASLLQLVPLQAVPAAAQ